MSLNTSFSDEKSAAAHLGLLILIAASLLSKDETDTWIALSSFFISVALPLLAAAWAMLPIQPGMGRRQFKLLLTTTWTGHITGFLAIACALGHFHPVSFFSFIAASIVAFLLFGARLTSAFGEDFGNEIHDLVENPSPTGEK